MWQLKNGLTNYEDEVNAGKYLGGNGSDKLKSKVMELAKDSKYVFNFYYSRYSGEVVDEALIKFAMKYYPECIAYEKVDYGYQAYVFGQIAEEMAKNLEWYYFDTDFSRGSETFEDFWYELETSYSNAGFWEMVGCFFVDDDEQQGLYDALYEEYYDMWGILPVTGLQWEMDDELMDTVRTYFNDVLDEDIQVNYQALQAAETRLAECQPIFAEEN